MTRLFQGTRKTPEQRLASYDQKISELTKGAQSVAKQWNRLKSTVNKDSVSTIKAKLKEEKTKIYEKGMETQTKYAHQRKFFYADGTSKIKGGLTFGENFKEGLRQARLYKQINKDLSKVSQYEKQVNQINEKITHLVKKHPELGRL